MLGYAFLFAIAFQLVTDFVASIYALGLLGTNIPPEIVAVLLFFAPALLLFTRKGLSRQGLAITGAVILAAVVIAGFLDTRGRMLVSGLGTAAFLVFLPSYLRERGERRDAAVGADLGAGLTLFLMVAWLAAAWSRAGREIVWNVRWQGSAVLAIAAAVWWWWNRDAVNSSLPATAVLPARFSKIAGLSLGIMSAFALLYFAFGAPNVIARWGGAECALILGALAVAWAAFALALAYLPARAVLHLRAIALAGSALFVMSLVATLLAYQPNFPADPAGYPYSAPQAPPWAMATLLLTLVLSPVIALDCALFAGELVRAQPSNRALAGGFLVAALFFVIAIFGNVFTTVYDYIPVVGPWFRDRLWLVYLALGIGLTLPLLFVRKETAPGHVASARIFRSMVVGYACTLGFVLIWAGLPPASAPGGSALRVLTYNIQQGYGADGQWSYPAQLEVLRASRVDVIGLQESDTNRIAGGNLDLVNYFAGSLDMYSYYGPNVVAGTFGIALLSRYPIENPRTFYMYSAGEQTAAIEAQITVGGRRFSIFVTHLGNDGPMVQQREFLSEASSRQNVIAMGDFNFRPDSEQYRVTAQVLADAWLLKWPSGVDDKGFNPARRIDHVFLSPGLAVRDAWYRTGSESDHPALVVEVGW